MSALKSARPVAVTCECWGGNCSGAGPHGTGDDDNCKAPATGTYRCEDMTTVLCRACGAEWEGDGDWSRVSGVRS